MKENSNVSVFNADISTAEADVIVNAANGWGYMGGKKARDGLLQGVSESLNRSTDGKMETYCIKKARRLTHIPSCILGRNKGEIFTSPSFGLKCKEGYQVIDVRSEESLSSNQRRRGVKCTAGVQRKMAENLSKLSHKLGRKLGHLIHVFCISRRGSEDNIYNK